MSTATVSSEDISVELVTTNISGKVRRETLHGRSYLVAPLRMVVEGVLNGNKGPLFYPESELARDPSAWNHMPIVVDHPMEDGRAITARRPDILEKQGIGYVFETNYGKALDAEGWFDELKTRKVSPATYQRLKDGQTIELSTGLGTRNEYAPGEFNGTPYTYIARDYRPDHLAILPDKVGACSVEDGCGVLVNQGSLELDWFVYNSRWPQSRRDKLSSKSFAGPHQSFPIKTQQDVDSAAKLIGKADNPDAVKAKVKSIAKRKGLTLPASWTGNSAKDTLKIFTQLGTLLSSNVTNDGGCGDGAGGFGSGNKCGKGRNGMGGGKGKKQSETSTAAPSTPQEIGGAQQRISQQIAAQLAAKGVKLPDQTHQRNPKIPKAPKGKSPKTRFTTPKPAKENGKIKGGAKAGGPTMKSLGNGKKKDLAQNIAAVRNSFYGHSGRPGERGGSVAGGGTPRDKASGFFHGVKSAAKGTAKAAAAFGVHLISSSVVPTAGFAAGAALGGTLGGGIGAGLGSAAGYGAGVGIGHQIAERFSPKGYYGAKTLGSTAGFLGGRHVVDKAIGGSKLTHQYLKYKASGGKANIVRFMKSRSALRRSKVSGK